MATLSTPANRNDDATNAADDLIAATRQALQALQVQRQSLEMEAEAVSSELLAPTGDDLKGPPMGIDTPLVDAEGYPRGDIDLYRARMLRGRLAEIKTDYKAVMKDVERHLQQLAMLTKSETEHQKDAEEYAARMAPKPKPKYDPVSKKWVVRNWDGTVAGAGESTKRSFDTLERQHQEEQRQLEQQQQQQPIPNEPQEAVPSAAVSTPPPVFVSSPPFARVTSVAPLSPAFEAGLRADDLIVAFGNISLESSSDGNPMMAVGQVVPMAASNNETIIVQVQRTSSSDSSSGFEAQWHTSPPQPTTAMAALQLRPRPWSGRGLLGCHIVPV